MQEMPAGFEGANAHARGTGIEGPPACMDRGKWIDRLEPQRIKAFQKCVPATEE